MTTQERLTTLEHQTEHLAQTLQKTGQLLEELSQKLHDNLHGIETTLRRHQDQLTHQHYQLAEITQRL